MYMDDLASFWDKAVFHIGNTTIQLGKLSALLFALALVGLIYIFLNKVFLKPIIIREKAYKSREKKHIRRRWVLLFVLIAATLIVWILGLDINLLQFGEQDISLLVVLLTMILLSFSSLIDWISTYVIYKDKPVEESRYQDQGPRRFPIGANIQFIIYTLAAILVLRGLNLDFRLFSYKDGEEVVDFVFSRLFSAVVIILVARVIAWILTSIVLARYYRMRNIEYSSQYAINQILTYIIFVLAIIVALENLGLKMTLLWGGAAALLVGIGLGLQQTFNDLISGVILLFERSVEVGAVLEIDGMVGTVRKIGIRTSIMETRDNLTVIVPNSRLIVNNVINWNHNDDKARFNVSVGVAYGSDTDLVRNVLIAVALQHPDVLNTPPPFVRFTQFADYDLVMELHFWSRKLIPIENIKSDLRFAIDKAFRENGIIVPYPQRDVRFRSYDPNVQAPPDRYH